jgi:hypothetical protein
MKKEIYITFKPDGTIQIEAEGFQGSECLSATQPYEKALGIKKDNSARQMKNISGQVQKNAAMHRNKY